MAKDALLSSLLTGSGGAVDCVEPEKGKLGDMAYWPTVTTKDQIPDWLRDNDYIVGGHPMPTYSYRRVPWFRDNRPCSVHVCLGFSRPPPHQRRQASLWLFNRRSCICFGLSTTFHTLRSHSYKVHHSWGKMDILGICVLALGAGSSMTFYAFYCRPVVQRVYWGLNLFSALAAAVVLFDSGGGGSKMRTLRGGVFTLLALSALLPFFHTASLMGWSRARDEIGAVWYLAEGMSLLLGVGLFVSRVPERLKPGSFDILGHSHQLFHICAIIGGAFHVATLVVGYNYRRMHPSC
ncbi:hypothetical protein V492_07317 [Pseudogymnoascus sp. VKM F-4246]|nr:hypothetical protein V492_07317 [Pseudogymnoascus sp. VKM F-4246]